MLYQIDDLRMVVETAKRLLTEEHIDKKSGQATTSPFMKTSQDNSKSKSKNEKKVSFSAVEAMERTTDSTERLASLMDKMDTKLEEMTSIGPEFTKVETEVAVIDKITIGPEIGLIAGTGTKIIIEEEETAMVIEVVIETTGLITGIVVGPETETIIEIGIDTAIGQTTEETIVTKGMETNQDHSRSRERDRDRSSSRESSQSRGGNQSNRDQSRNEDRRQSRNNTRDRSESRLRSSSCVSTNRDRCRCYRCNEYDHFARECPNVVTDGSSDDMGASICEC